MKWNDRIEKNFFKKIKRYIACKIKALGYVKDESGDYVLTSEAAEAIAQALINEGYTITKN